MKYSLTLLLTFTATFLSANTVDVYFGTGGGEAAGIYHSKLNTETGTLTAASLVAQVQSPEFLAFHPNRRHLYAVAQLQGKASVIAYALAPDGALTELQSQAIPDGAAAHISVHPSGRLLLTAQYGAGTVALFPINADGTLEPCKQVIQHQGGSGVAGKRQQSAHPHWTGFAPDGRFAFVPDLGLDQIIIYQVQLQPVSIHKIGYAQAPAGAGPRHMKFSVDGQFIFLLNELSLSVSTFDYQARTGQSERLSTTPSLSPELQAQEAINAGSEILVHPNGLYVYAANRGHDSVTSFRVSPDDGQLSVIDIEPIRGAWPRSINLDSSGRWLLAAGAHSNTVTVLEIDTATGMLSYSGKRIINVPNAICIVLND
ncbi:lactonase family protein [Coraliomargarita sp. SDUM461004]|uniref:Lactonase family protein n=1 Tax=Thalassobacterium sedimentorum TaxID=3041258 RepID=A0ABU1ALD2_9BACT|nr:lactonase family protein [Coraliomargarita sp. SDUM461004]MDQ8195598.1 lactonase family protein [Coraliomargarita sp. SDUM461004]